MPFSFEVKETDLLGRIGVVRTSGKSIETPCLLPVIHPVSQAVSTKELKSMGFSALMTNSYIIRSRRKDEAIRRGIHEMLDFDGILMTDSGGYQVLEYGDIGIGYQDVASFQADIGSDIAVTLDRPTGYPQSRKAAIESVTYSRDNAAATLREYGAKETTWVGPVQGGLFEDLVSKSATALWKAGFEFLALGSPVQVMENYMFADLVRMIFAARGPIPYSMPLHLFGAGHPLTMSLAVATGCDTFDSASYILFARSGRYMSRGGVLSLDAMKYLPCSCAVCSKTTVNELREIDEQERVKRLSIHNLYLLREELEACKEAIVEGRLWDLVEERSMSHPRLREAFAELSRRSHLLVEGTPLLKGRGLLIRSTEDLRRPELLAAQERLSKVLKSQPHGKRALVSKWGSVPVEKLWIRTPGRTRKHEGNPYGSIGGSVDRYRVHPTLGVYPAELDFVYPFTQVVMTPLTSDAVEGQTREAAAVLRRLGYASVRKESDGKRRKTRRSGTDGKLRSRRIRRVVSPSLRSSSSHLRSPRRP